MRETEDQERHDQEEAQQQVQGDHQHVEERLLRGAQIPGERGHAREIKAVGTEQGEADQDDPEEGTQSRADGGRINPAFAVAHGADLY